MGNILELQHIAGTTGSYTRSYAYAYAGTNPSNSRLNNTDVGSMTNKLYYDARGNVSSMSHLSVMDYDALNQMSHVTAGTVDAYYQYSGGQRIRKHLPVSGTDKAEQRIYLGCVDS